MKIVKKIGSICTIVTALAGCGFSREYLKPDLEIKTDEKTIRAYDKNRDGKWDAFTVTNTTNGHKVLAEDTDYNGSWETIGCIYNTKILKTSNPTTMVLFDKDNDGVYENGAISTEWSFLELGKGCYTFKDLDRDGVFDECKYDYKKSTWVHIPSMSELRKVKDIVNHNSQKMQILLKTYLKEIKNK